MVEKKKGGLSEIDKELLFRGCSTELRNKMLEKECDHPEENTIIILDDNKTHIKCNVCYKAWEYKGKLVTATTFKEPKKQTLWDTWVKKYPVMESSKQNDARIADMKFISDWMEQNK